MGVMDLHGSFLGLRCDCDVEELLLGPDVGEGAAQAALEVVPGDVEVLDGGSHGD